MKRNTEPTPAKVVAKDVPAKSIASKDTSKSKPASKDTPPKKTSKSMSKAAATLGSLGGIAKQRNKERAMNPFFNSQARLGAITRNY